MSTLSNLAKTLRTRALVIAAFVRRDFLFHWSYKFWFLYELGSVVSSVVTVFFVGRMFAGNTPEAVAAYKADYFTFALIGLAFIDYMWVSMRVYAQQVRIAQFTGTLQAMFATPISPFEIIAYSSAYTYLWTIFRSFLYLLIGVGALGASLPDVNLASAILFTVLIVLTFSGIGIASSAMTLYLKQSDPLTSFIGGISFLFGGIVYPVQSLPQPLHDMAWCLPMTHAVEGLRRALLQGQSLRELWPHAAVLVAWALVVFPLSFWLLKRVMLALSREGSFNAY